MDISPLLLDLEVIKQVGENDKLAVCILPGNTRLSVDSHHWVISGAYRKYYGYNRETCITYLETLFDNIDRTANLIINGQHHELGNMLCDAIKNSIPGLNNLKNTYSKDSVINAKIVLCINKIKTINNTLETFTKDSMDSINEMEPINESPIPENHTSNASYFYI